jgi:hypothetical protein
VLCGSGGQHYLFPCHGQRIYRCDGCGLARLDPLPARAIVRSFYAGTNGHDPYEHDVYENGSLTEIRAAERYCDLLQRIGVGDGPLLVIAPPGHPLSEVAAARGIRTTVVSDIGQVAEVAGVGVYRAAAILFQLERSADPIDVLTRIHLLLDEDGQLMVVAPSLDSLSARLLRTNWTEWRPENLHYFDRQTIQSALLLSGFHKTRIRSDIRRYTLEHIRDRARTLPGTWLTRVVRTVCDIVPRQIAHAIRISLPVSAMIVVAQRNPRRERPLLSIIMPVFNERTTVQHAIDAVLNKQLVDLEKEIIVVESNSSDGTRDLVVAYRDHPEVKLILQDSPRGKGNAVRTGFAHASGDFILIQDADQEYDVDDYDSLLTPLRTYQTAFVLGSRHTQGWKIRQFNNQPGVSAFFNLGHLFFLTLFNMLYRQSLRDPFTMYKVFRRDCLYGLEFECNRFDFDFELVIKLLRKGYKPIELPVNYRSRSFQEGKKVSAVRDPLTWIRALVRYRFGRVWSPDL